MRNFEIQWKTLEDKKANEDVPETPKISKALPVIKWTDSFRDFLARVIGVRTIPLTYVIREQENVPAAPQLAINQPHSIEHGSVEAELVARASHIHALFRDDNVSVYHYLEEATRSTSYAASIKPYTRAKNGRGAWLAIVSQYAGVDKWEAEIKKQEQLLHTRVWKGQSNFSLESFISQHRNAYVSMEACAQHVDFQLPNGHSRVGFLLNAIQCSDAGLQAAMASVRTDNGVGGKRSDFEATASHLLPYDPVAIKRNTSAKRDHSQVSAIDVLATQTQPSSKPSIGTTGVHLRWHSRGEFRKLSAAQKTELKEFHKNNPKKDGPQKETQQTKKMKKDLKALVAATIREALQKESNEQANEERDTAYIMSLLKKAESQSSSSTNSPTVSVASAIDDPSSTLKSILKRKRG